MNCFHCGKPLNNALETIFIIRPTGARFEYDNDLYRADYFGGLAPLDGPRQGGMKISLETIDNLFKAFHRECFFELAGPNYVP